jgi:hypothetical protein
MGFRVFDTIRIIEQKSSHQPTRNRASAPAFPKKRVGASIPEETIVLFLPVAQPFPR